MTDPWTFCATHFIFDRLFTLLPPLDLYGFYRKLSHLRGLPRSGPCHFQSSFRVQNDFISALLLPAAIARHFITEFLVLRCKYLWRMCRPTTRHNNNHIEIRAISSTQKKCTILRNIT